MNKLSQIVLVLLLVLAGRRAEAYPAVLFNPTNNILLVTNVTATNWNVIGGISLNGDLITDWPSGGGGGGAANTNGLASTNWVGSNFALKTTVPSTNGFTDPFSATNKLASTNWVGQNFATQSSIPSTNGFTDPFSATNKMASTNWVGQNFALQSSVPGTNGFTDALSATNKLASTNWVGANFTLASTLGALAMQNTVTSNQLSGKINLGQIDPQPGTGSVNSNTFSGKLNLAQIDPQPASVGITNQLASTNWVEQNFTPINTAVTNNQPGTINLATNGTLDVSNLVAHGSVVGAGSVKAASFINNSGTFQSDTSGNTIVHNLQATVFDFSSFPSSLKDVLGSTGAQGNYLGHNANGPVWQGITQADVGGIGNAAVNNTNTMSIGGNAATSTLSSNTLTTPAFLTPAQFGAACDGVTDDTLALSNAFKALNNGPITILDGCGKTNVISQQLPTLNRDHITIQNCIFYVTSTNITAIPRGIGASYFNFLNNTLVCVPGLSGITWTNCVGLDTDFGTIGAYNFSSIISGNRIQGFWRDIVVGGSTEQLISGNSLWNCWSNAIYFKPNNGVTEDWNDIERNDIDNFNGPVAPTRNQLTNVILIQIDERAYALKIARNPMADAKQMIVDNGGGTVYMEDAGGGGWFMSNSNLCPFVFWNVDLTVNKMSCGDGASASSNAIALFGLYFTNRESFFLTSDHFHNVGAQQSVGQSYDLWFPGGTGDGMQYPVCDGNGYTVSHVAFGDAGTIKPFGNIGHNGLLDIDIKFSGNVQFTNGLALPLNSIAVGADNTANGSVTANHAHAFNFVGFSYPNSTADLGLLGYDAENDHTSLLIGNTTGGANGPTEIDFYAAAGGVASSASQILKLKTTDLSPPAHPLDLGTTSSRWGNIFATNFVGNASGLTNISSNSLNVATWQLATNLNGGKADTATNIYLTALNTNGMQITPINGQVAMFTNVAGIWEMVPVTPSSGGGGGTVDSPMVINAPGYSSYGLGETFYPLFAQFPAQETVINYAQGILPFACTVHGLAVQAYCPNSMESGNNMWFYFRTNGVLAGDPSQRVEFVGVGSGFYYATSSVSFQFPGGTNAIVFCVSNNAASQGNPMLHVGALLAH